MILLLVACPVEQLGIELPPGGAAAISQEDLQRDVLGLLGADPGGWFAKRAGQMGLEVRRGEGWVCGQRGEPTRAWVAPWPRGVDEAASGAALLSVAKGWHTLDEPAPSAYCVASGAVPHTDPRALGPLAPGPLDPAALRSGTADPARPFEGLDYRELEAKARQLFGLDAKLAGRAVPPTDPAEAPRGTAPPPPAPRPPGG